MKSKHIVMAIAALSFSALAAAQIVDENTKNEQYSAQKQPAASNQYNQQLAMLLEVAGDAKSEQSTKLVQTALNIQKWFANRDAYSGDGEHRFRFYREHLNSTHWVHDIFNLSVHDGQF